MFRFSSCSHHGHQPTQSIWVILTCCIALKHRIVNDWRRRTISPRLHHPRWLIVTCVLSCQKVLSPKSFYYRNPMRNLPLRHHWIQQANQGQADGSVGDITRRKSLNSPVSMSIDHSIVQIRPVYFFLNSILRTKSWFCWPKLCPAISSYPCRRTVSFILRICPILPNNDEAFDNQNRAPLPLAWAAAKLSPVTRHRRRYRSNACDNSVRLRLNVENRPKRSKWKLRRSRMKCSSPRRTVVWSLRWIRLRNRVEKNCMFICRKYFSVSWSEFLPMSRAYLTIVVIHWAEVFLLSIKAAKISAVQSECFCQGNHIARSNCCCSD